MEVDKSQQQYNIPIYPYVDVPPRQTSSGSSGSRPKAIGLRKGKKVDISSSQPKNSEEEEEPKRRKLLPSERPLIVQRTMPYSIVSDLNHIKTNVTVAQLLTLPTFRNELARALRPRRKKTKENEEQSLEIPL